MAIFNSPLFENMHNSIQNLVIYTSRGNQVIKGKPLLVHNPRSLKQQQVRARFKAVSNLSSRLYTVAQIGFPDLYKTNSRCAFSRTNMQVFEVDELLNVRADYRLLACSSGAQAVPKMTAVWNDKGDVLTVESLPQPISALSTRSDQLYVVVLDSDTLMWKLFLFGERGMPQQHAFSLPKTWQAKNVYVYTFAVSPNGKRTSNTVWLV